MKFLESRGDDNLAETAQLVSAEPDVTVVERNAAADQFICLACDGIFDVFLNEELADYINSQLKVRGDDLEQLCSDVIDTTLHKVRSAPIKWGASFRWSCLPNSAWSSIETMTIGKTRLSL